MCSFSCAVVYVQLLWGMMGLEAQVVALVGGVFYKLWCLDWRPSFFIARWWMFRKGRAPSFSTSMVSLIAQHTLLRWWSKFPSVPPFTVQKMFSTYRFQYRWHWSESVIEVMRWRWYIITITIIRCRELGGTCVCPPAYNKYHIMQIAIMWCGITLLLQLLCPLCPPNYKQNLKVVNHSFDII